MLQTVTSYFLSMCRSVDALRRLVLMLVLAALAPPAPAARASNPTPAAANRRYDIPAGDATETLQRYIEQSGEQILYVVPTVRGVKTNAVIAECTAREAIERMVAKTVLIVVEDPQTGAVMIQRSTPSRAPPAAAPAPPPETPKSAQPKHNQSPSMKNRTFLAIIAGWFLTTGAVDAQTAETGGTLTGFVSNAVTGRTLVGARVEMPQLNRSGVTDNTGRYVIAAVPAGSYEIVASYAGLDAKRSVANSDGRSPQAINFSLTSAVYALEEFRVTGEREGHAAAVTAQKNAPNLVNVLSLDSFGNLPNMDVGELAIRFPGVAGGVNNEGVVNRIMVRGMPGESTRTLVDGTMMATSQTFARLFQSSSLTGAMFDQFELTKGFTPDKPVDSLGGSVNMKSRSPLSMSERRRTVYNIAARWAPPFTTQVPWRRAHPLHPLLNLTHEEVFDVFGGSRNLGVAINAFYSENVFGYFSTNRDYENTITKPAYLWDYRTADTFNNRKKGSIGAKIDYRLSSATKISLNTVYNDAREPFNQNNQVRAFANQSVGTTGTAGILPGYTDSITQVRANTGSTIDFTRTMNAFFVRMRHLDLGVEHTWNNLDVDYNAVYSRSAINVGNRNGGNLTMRLANVGWILDRTYSDLYPRFVQTEGPSLSDPQNYRPTSGGLATTQQNQQDVIKELRANARYRLPTSVPISIKAGVQWREQGDLQYYRGHRWNYLGKGGIPSDPSMVTWDSIKSGRNIPQWNPAALIHDERPVDPSLWAEDLYFNRQIAYTNSKGITETCKVGYVMTQGKIGNLSLLAGVRIENTEDSSWGWTRQRFPSTAAQQAADPVGSADRDYAQNRRELKGDYTKSFPSAHLTYDVTRKLKARLSWSTSFGRPPMTSLMPSESISEVNQTITVSNPSLLPQMTKNWDASVDYYLEPVGLFSVGWFQKSISKYIVSGVLQGTVSSGADNGFNGEYSGFKLLSASNAGNADVKGWEFSYQQQLSFLPGILRGLSVSANYTAIDTNGNFGATTQISSGQVAGFVPRTGNLSLSWRYRKFAARVLYSYTSDYILSYTATSVGRNQYRFAREITNLGVDYAIKPALKFSIDVNNLTNQPIANYRGVPSQLETYVAQGVAITAGFSGRF